MAKKENENEFEDLNDGGSINEADDSFGLPDIDYEPIDRTEETRESDPSPYAEEEVTSSDEPDTAETEETDSSEAFMYAHRTDEDTTSDFETSDSSGSSEDSSENIFGTTEEEPAEVASVDVSAQEEPAQEEYVPGSYTPKHTSSSNTGAIVGIILVIILAALGIWWFVYEQPRREDVAAQEQAAAEEEAREAREREAAAAEQQRLLEQEQAAREAEEAQLAAEETNNEPGTVQTISERTGRYYIVVTSSIDGDLAMDYAKDLADKGNSVKIIAPYGNVKFHRVAVTDVETLAQAESRANELKAEYGDGVWVMRY